MRRTQVYLDEGQHEMLKTRARREGKTMALILREIIDAHFRREDRRAAGDPFDGVIGIGKGDGAAVAENHAEYLYGDRSK